MLLEEVAKRATDGDASEFLEIETPDVFARIDVTPTLTGFSFRSKQIGKLDIIAAQIPSG